MWILLCLLRYRDELQMFSLRFAFVVFFFCFLSVVPKRFLFYFYYFYHSLLFEYAFLHLPYMILSDVYVVLCWFFFFAVFVVCLFVSFCFLLIKYVMNFDLVKASHKKSKVLINILFVLFSGILFVCLLVFILIVGDLVFYLGINRLHLLIFVLEHN